MGCEHQGGECPEERRGLRREMWSLLAPTGWEEENVPGDKAETELPERQEANQESTVT